MSEPMKEEEEVPETEHAENPENPEPEVSTEHDAVEFSFMGPENIYFF